MWIKKNRKKHSSLFKAAHVRTVWTRLLDYHTYHEFKEEGNDNGDNDDNDDEAYPPPWGTPSIAALEEPVPLLRLSRGIPAP